MGGVKSYRSRTAIHQPLSAKGDRERERGREKIRLVITVWVRTAKSEEQVFK